MSESGPSNFIRTIMEEDLRSGRHQQIVTRFPPEPSGFLHIGHAKAICISFGLAEQLGGRCHLRMDDTNPELEDQTFVDAIERDIRWLGFDWGAHRYNASDYFGQLYAWAKLLIDKGLAYVDEQSSEDLRTGRGTVEQPGVNSPWRDRPAAESHARLEEMKRGDHREGSMVLRARIDMAHPNMLLRDPLLYRIRHRAHHATGDEWHIYPLYDWAHGQSDALEGVTHSLCSLEFEVHRPLYDWFLEHLPVEHRPRQYEFARMSIGYTLTSKRKLRQLVADGHVEGWDDPRMPTLAGLRNRGVPPEAIRDLVEQVGVARAANSIVDPLLFENAIRNRLNHEAPRVMVVLDPLEVVVTNWDRPTDPLEASYWPHDVPREGSRTVPFSGRLYLERADFAAEPPKGFKRLAPGRSVRLRYGYVVTYEGHEVGDDGEVVRVRVRVEEGSRGGTTPDRPDAPKIWSTLHWVDAEAALPVEVRLYDRLFTEMEPGAERDFLEDLNPESLKTVSGLAEPSLGSAAEGERFQFERTGYFAVARAASAGAGLSFNRIVPLKDTWARRAPPPEKPPRKAAATPEDTAPALTEVGEALVRRGLSSSEAATLQADDALRALFEAAVRHHDAPKAVAGWVVTEVAREAKDRPVAELPLTGESLGALVGLIAGGTISHATGKQVFQRLVKEGGDPAAIVAEEGLQQITDPAAVQAVVDEVLTAFPERVEAYRGGRKGLQGFFIGQVMQRTSGKAKPELVRELVSRALDN